ncbi:MAG: hypothetical protein HOW73_37895 [Polyangiaceae bacterium]|nr:hypothetical protein [Polyangiaceae bacterium]
MTVAATACDAPRDESEAGGASLGGAAGHGGEGGSMEQEPSPCGEIANAPAFAIGTGEVCYEALEDGDVVPQMAGPQNGYHLWVALVCADCPRDIIVVTGAKREDADEWLSDTAERVVELKSMQVAGLFAGMPGTPTDPSSFVPEGTPVRLVAEARDLDGTILHSAEKSVVVGPVELWLNQCDPNPDTCGHPGGDPCC